MSLTYSGVEPQPSLAWTFESSNVDIVTGLAPSSQVSPGPAQLQGSAALVTNAPTSNTALYCTGPYGTNSNYMNLGTSTPAKFDYNSSNLFCEFWWYTSNTSTGNLNTPIGLALPTGTTSDWTWYTQVRLNSGFSFNVAGSPGLQTASLTTQTWYHFAVSIDSTNKNFYLFVNGTLAAGPTAYTGTLTYNSAHSIQIGNSPRLASNYYYDQYIRDLRVVQGGVVPTTSFTPGSAPFSYTLPSYVTGSGSVVFTLLGQFVTYNPSGKYGSSAAMRNLVTRYTWPFTPSINSGVTISFWIKFDSLAAGISGSSGSSFGDRYYSFINGTPRFELVFVDNTFSYKGVTSSVVPSISTWYHVTYVFGNGSISQYINGSINGTRSDTPQTGLVFDTNLAFGGLAGSTTGTSKFELDDLRIYNTALTAAQVQSVYSSQGAPAPSRAMPLPKLAWDFQNSNVDYVSSLSPSFSTTAGALTAAPTYTAGKYGQAISFVNSPNLTGTVNCCVFYDLSLSSSGCAISHWVNPSYGQGYYPSWNYITISSANYANWMSYYNSGTSNSYVYTFGQSAGGNVGFSSTTPLPYNTWSHVTFVFNNGLFSLYMNGTLVNSFSFNSSANFTFIRVGAYLNNFAAMTGAVDDLRIFDRALTSAQVQSIYNQQGVPGRGSVQATPTYNAPLTGASNLNRVYGLQRLTTAYNGNIINLRRSSDNTNVNFTVDSTNTSLVTASGGQSISSWLGAGTANVVIWYDQSGNGRNLTQLTNGSQPGFSATTGLLYSTGLFMNFPDAMSITDASFSVGYIQRAYNANGTDQWYKQDPFVAGERGGTTNDYGLVIGGPGLFGFGTGTTDGPASTIATNGSGVYSFMTCTRNSTTGQVLLYNGTGSGTSFTKNTGALSGPSPTTMGQNTSGHMPATLGADVSSFFMFDSVKSQPEIASIASRFVNSTFTASPVRLTGTPLFTQISAAAKSSAVGAFSLRAVNGTSVRAVNVAPGGAFPITGFSTSATQSTNQFTQTLTGYPFTGSYVANCSTFYSASGTEQPWRCFDKNNNGTWWTTSTGSYSSSTGLYAAGVYSTTISGSAYAGEWIQIQLPVSITLLSYTIYNASSFNNRAPVDFKIAGSNDGTTWILVDTQTAITSWLSSTTNLTFTPINPGTYSYYRLCVNKIGPTPSYLSIGELVLNGTVPSLAQDFYADRRGNLLTAPVTGQSLASWLGGATGYVTTWYDQSGAGNHMSCSSAGIQPKIDLVNNFIDLKTSAYFDVSAGTTGPVPFQSSKNYTVVFRHGQFNGSGLFCATQNAAGPYGNLVNNFKKGTGSTYTQYWYGNDVNNKGVLATGNRVSYKWDGTNRSLYVNGTLADATASSGWAQTSSSIQMIGKTNFDATMNGELYGAFMFNTALSDSDRILVENFS